KFFGTLYNTYSFFSLYANVDGFCGKEKEIPINERQEIDRWILSCLNTLIKGVDSSLNDYEPTRAGRLIDDFVNDDLSNWYVRLNRKRFWGKEMGKDKLSAYQTLYSCLKTIAKLLAPFSPFYSDELYMDLMKVTKEEDVCSVHLSDFPIAEEELIDKDLEERMKMAQKITSMVLALRRKVNIKVRQPLQCIMIPAVDATQKKHIEMVKDLVLNEVNVKHLKFVEGSGILVKRVKCNFRLMGKKFGKLMKSIASIMDALSQEEILKFETTGEIHLKVDNEDITVESSDVDIISEDIPGWLVTNEGNLTVALEIELNEELLAEGMAREIINRIQNLRKDSGFEITDRISVKITPNKEIKKSLDAFSDYVKLQVLADEILFSENDGKEIDFEDFKINIKIEKI
ncbi:MAG: DUF5915 domain-containing protein, partial [Prevotella sp.]|nr:DUF5915 domain-containing protein [Prevotella sp.]